MQYFTLLLATVFIFSGCASKKPEPTKKVTQSVQKLDLSKINYPSKIGGYLLQNKQTLKNRRQGIMIRYIKKTKTTSYLDCNIYPKGEDKNITTHYKDILSGISFMKKEGVLKQADILKEEHIMIDAKHSALRTIFEMQNSITAYYSVLYLVPFEDHYIYVRFSNPHKAEFLQSDYGEKTLKELYKAIKFNK